MKARNVLIGLTLGCMLILGFSMVAAGNAQTGEQSASLLASGSQRYCGIAYRYRYILVCEQSANLLASGLQGASGSAIGPDGALYVTEGAAGRITRVDPESGELTNFAEGLPVAVLPIGGATDLVFIDQTAYVLVTMVGEDLPVPVAQPAIVGIYRIDGPNSYTVIADIGQWSIDNPSESDVFIPSGVHYAIEKYREGFLVSDGHHNRILHVSGSGVVSEFMTFGNIVPTGLEISGNQVFMAEAGPNPHLPEDGKIVSFGGNSSSVVEVASGAPLLVDVEFGIGRTLYGLAQGIFPVGSEDGSPALPGTGSLVQVNGDGSFTTIVAGLDRPTSVDFSGNTAFVITLTGEVWKIDNVSEPPFGMRR